MNNFWSIVFALVFVGLIISILCSLPVMWLWNWLMPVIFGLPTISWLQAFGLCILIRLLIPTSSNKSNNN